ncbi:MAG TPA: hypothetical protein VIG64_13910, partial [Actinomycetota bacterium]
MWVATLKGADLRQADLRNAIVPPRELKTAVTDDPASLMNAAECPSPGGELSESSEAFSDQALGGQLAVRALPILVDLLDQFDRDRRRDLMFGAGLVETVAARQHLRHFHDSRLRVLSKP